MMKTLLAAAALVSLPLAAQANTINIGFDTGDATFDGAQRLVGYEQDGIAFEISQTRLTGAGATHANLYMSTNPNPDDDLVPAVQDPDVIFGNVLIRQNAATTNRPNDAAGNGYIDLTVTKGTFELLGFSAIDDGVFSLELNGTMLATLDPGDDNAVATASFVSPLITVGDVLRVNYIGSGAVDSFIVAPAPIPLPAGGLLLIGGIAGLMIARRRSAAKA